MLEADHVLTAREFLARSDQEFAAGETLQACEKLWGAAAHAVIAVAKQRGWRNNNHNALGRVVRRLAEESGETNLVTQFKAAEKCHANFYHGFLDGEREEDELETYKVPAQRFIERMLEIHSGEITRQ